MIRFFTILGLVFFLLWSGYQTHQHPQLKFNSLLDRITHPFDTRLRYRIVDVDPRFKLTTEQVKQLSMQATQIWKDGTGQDYFVYAPNAQLAIHFIYDERQIESEQRREHLSQLETGQRQWLDKKQRLDQTEQEILNNKQFLDLKQQQLNQQIQQYNQEQLTAQQRPASIVDRDYFQRRQQALQDNIQQVQQEITQYNQKISTLNQQVDELNQLNQQLDQSVHQYKQRFQPHLFHKGLFNGREILIYEFESEDDLRLTLAHELGHALGLQHANDPTALMYPLMKDQNAENFSLTQADRELLINR
ncbi:MULTISPECIES: matrixin family metalloprotease [Acinetobacter]|uniref:matrixin family metalloprotease n=1 Tax=Acinetobacter TaxID=469 RepID=UPI000C4E13CB|nr:MULTISPECIES: matrixin family metalloprotease [Acinetobacter]MBT51600.1 matrixin [Acinetobacter sp.]HJP47742.1 matrixin family metalloprotease [Acinetobacter venetianus]|tara:strand:- start:1174 stop:2085 length:912 start_codon:yes stop_codon:yes gene_type:complete